MRPALAPHLSCKICVFAVSIFPGRYWKTEGKNDEEEVFLLNY